MTYERAATACASSSWKPQGRLCGPGAPRVPHPAGDSLGTTPATYCSSGTMLTVRAAPSELYIASIEPLTVRFPPPWHSWRALDPVAGSPSPGFESGLAVGSDTLVLESDHGPAHPGPTKTSQPPPAGLIRTA